ncbi:MAG: nucleotide exchange factor GrpE [Verrucomicrobiaceae bacterium]|nr:nucleotide exchange factor GrpE [Verrucomicrobiaceae bacterium]
MTEQQNNPVETENPAAPEDQTAETVVDIASLQAEIEQLQQQLADAKDQTLRTAAEAQNVRRRAEKDVESAHKYALEKFASSVLSVADNLERTLEVADRSNEALKPLTEGVELTSKTLFDALTRFHVEQVDPLGAPFDPAFHEAVAMVENPAAEPNTVLQVMQKGYTLNGRLLRAAMVVVAKGTPKKIDENA